MGDILAANVTYTINERQRIGKKYFVEATIAFGNGVLTYPTGGVPLTTGSLGFRRGIDALMILESNSDALLYEWDKSANTISIYTEARVEQTGGATATAATSLEVYAVGW